MLVVGNEVYVGCKSYSIYIFFEKLKLFICILIVKIKLGYKNV